MLPRLKAEEAIFLSNIVAVGNGTLKEGEGQRILREWQDQARRPGRVETLSKEKTETALAVMGIQVCHGKN